METRPCGHSGLNLPVLGLGTWAFGGGSYWGPQDQSDVDAVVARALDRGINYFDTAEMYNAGASEAALGRALRGRREKALIGSKISPSHTSPATLRACCEASLRRLETDYLDLYMVHWPIHANSLRHFTTDEAILRRPPTTAEAFGTLADLQREGKIRHIGVSNFGVRQLSEVAALGVRLAVNELPYNLLMRAIEPDIAPYCRAHGIGIIGYMALMQGVLAGDYASFDALPPPRTRTRHFSGQRQGSRHGEPGFEALTWQTVQELRRIARAAGWSLSDMAIAWALANPDIACLLAGCRTSAQLEENAHAVNHPLPEALKRQLDDATTALLQALGSNPDYYQSTADTRIW